MCIITVFLMNGPTVERTDCRKDGREKNTDDTATADREWISNVTFMKWNI